MYIAKDGHISEIENNLHVNKYEKPWDKRLNELANLEAGWLDGFMGNPMVPADITQARMLLEVLFPDVDVDSMLPGIFPMEDGICLEWGSPAYLLSIELRDGGSEAYFTCIPDINEDAEIETDNLDDLILFTQKHLAHLKALEPMETMNALDVKLHKAENTSMSRREGAGNE